MNTNCYCLYHLPHCGFDPYSLYAITKISRKQSTITLKVLISQNTYLRARFPSNQAATSLAGQRRKGEETRERKGREKREKEK